MRNRWTATPAKQRDYQGKYSVPVPEPTTTLAPQPLSARQEFDNERQQARDAAAAKERAERAPENTRLRKFFSQPLEDLKDYLKSPRSRDCYFKTTAQKGDCTKHERQSAVFDDFINELSVQNITLSDTYQQRLVMYALAQAMHQGIVLTGLNTWMDAFARLKSLQVHSDGDITQTTTPAPAQKSVDAMELLYTETRDGLRQAIAITQDRLVDAARPLFNEWIASLEQHWSFVASDSDRKVAGEEAEKLGLNLADRRSYDRLRIHLGKQHFFPLLLTHEEKISEDLEKFKRDNPTATARDERAFLQQKKNERMG